MHVPHWALAQSAAGPLVWMVRGADAGRFVNLDLPPDEIARGEALGDWQNAQTHGALDLRPAEPGAPLQSAKPPPPPKDPPPPVTRDMPSEPPAKRGPGRPRKQKPPYDNRMMSTTTRGAPRSDGGE